MWRNSPKVRELRKLLDKHGFELVDVANTGGGHFRLTVAGVPVPYFTASSPSDYRAAQNLVSDLRRLRRQSGA